MIHLKAWWHGVRGILSWNTLTVIWDEIETFRKKIKVRLLGSTVIQSIRRAEGYEQPTCLQPAFPSLVFFACRALAFQHLFNLMRGNVL